MRIQKARSLSWIFALPDGDLLNQLPPAQRQLVIDYFERLNRERPRSGPPGGEVR